MTDDAQSLAEQCVTSVYATEALLCNLQEQKIKYRRVDIIMVRFRPSPESQRPKKAAGESESARPG